MNGIYLTITPDGKLVTSSAPDHAKPLREKKGNSLIEDLSSYVVVDIETTGLDPNCDDIIELAGIKVEDDVVIDQFQSLVNPGYEISEFITELTGITNDMLHDAPQLENILSAFIEFVGSSIIIGHNVNFDINFIYDNCMRFLDCALPNDYIDTMRVSRRMFQSEQHHRLIDLLERFGIADNVEHRALSDVLKTMQCYEYMKRHAVENNISFQSLYPQKGKSRTKRVANTIDIPDTKDNPSVTYDINTESPIYGKLFVFTGALERMKRDDAMQAVLSIGGECSNSVTKKTNYLVLGNNDYCPTIKDGKSSKQKKAEQYKLSGLDIEIISENVFYDMINESGNE